MIIPCRWWRRLKKRRVISYIVALLFVYFFIQETVRYFAAKPIHNSLKLLKNLKLSVEPDRSTVILEPPVNSNISCEGEPGAGDGLVLLIMVISHPVHQARRNLIREVFKEMRPLWEEHFQTELTNALAKGKEETVPEWITKPVRNLFEVLFFLGKPEDKAVMEFIKSESDKHGDLIMDDFQESYLNLTLKTMRMLKWVNLNCGRATFLLKMDDDVFLNVPKLISFLFSSTAFKAPDTLIAGYIYDEILVDRSPYSKWYTPEGVYPVSRFPQFVAGFTYLLGMEAAKNIYSVALNTSPFHLEDVFLTGFVASEIGYQLSHLGDISTFLLVKDLITTPSKNWYKKKMVVHEVNARQFRCWTILSTTLRSNKTDGCSWLMLILSSL